jgi:hypothetical protein
MFTTVFPPVLSQADILYMYTYIMYHVYHISSIIFKSYIYQEKRTALHLAAGGGHDKIVETLVEAKADPCAQDMVSVLKETRLDADRGMC